MNFKKSIAVFMFFTVIVCALFAGERTIPVDIFLMIDKSLSMAEESKFGSMHRWVRDELISQMVIAEDNVIIYSFYEKPELLLDLQVKNEKDRNKIIEVIDNITPDGKYTDIGRALDTIQHALNKSKKNGRHKILILLTDLKQDAPWTSKYSGKQESFKSPYLAEARIIQHDKWYEITLDMDIQDRVVKTTQELYSGVIKNEKSSRVQSDQNAALIKNETKVMEKDKD